MAKRKSTRRIRRASASSRKSRSRGRAKTRTSAPTSVRRAPRKSGKKRGTGKTKTLAATLGLAALGAGLTAAVRNTSSATPTDRVSELIRKTRLLQAAAAKTIQNISDAGFKNDLLQLSNEGDNYIKEALDARKNSSRMFRETGFHDYVNDFASMLQIINVQIPNQPVSLWNRINPFR